MKKQAIRANQCRKQRKPDPTCELRCQKSNESTLHLEHCTSETKCPGFSRIRDLFPKSPKKTCSKTRADTNEHSTPSEKRKPHKLKACMAVPVKQSNVKSINHDSSEDHGSSPEDPESICGDW
jgi:hypothetical protein